VRSRVEHRPRRRVTDTKRGASGAMPLDGVPQDRSSPRRRGKNRIDTRNREPGALVGRSGTKKCGTGRVPREAAAEAAPRREASAPVGFDRTQKLARPAGIAQQAAQARQRMFTSASRDLFQRFIGRRSIAVSLE